jgi:hypothetical protein
MECIYDREMCLDMLINNINHIPDKINNPSWSTLIGNYNLMKSEIEYIKEKIKYYNKLEDEITLFLKIDKLDKIINDILS